MKEKFKTKKSPVKPVSGMAKPKAKSGLAKKIKKVVKKPSKTPKVVKEVLSDLSLKFIDTSVKYGTDKNDHGYMPFYAQYLPQYPERLLEFGVLKGASIKMWRELFPDADIHCVDLFKEFDPRTGLQELNVTCHQGSQADYDFLYTIPGHFDVIIDDASHQADLTMITFKHCMVNLLKSGGIYFVEDLHCSMEEYYWASVKSFSDTPLSIFQNWTKENGLPVTRFFDSHEKELFDSLIDNITVVNAKLAVITRK